MADISDILDELELLMNNWDEFTNKDIFKLLVLIIKLQFSISLNQEKIIENLKDKKSGGIDLTITKETSYG